MAGGYRPGTGGPRPGTGRKPVEKATKVPADIRAAARKCRLTPLEYMLAVLNDEDASQERRDRMAQAAAPYVHARPAPAASDAPGKKEIRAEAAKTAGAGSEWGEDLAFRAAPRAN